VLSARRAMVDGLPAPWEIFTQVPCPDGHCVPLFIRVARLVREPSMCSSLWVAADMVVLRVARGRLRMVSSVCVVLCLRCG
jgi:hypothetical protein